MAPVRRSQKGAGNHRAANSTAKAASTSKNKQKAVIAKEEPRKDDEEGSEDDETQFDGDFILLEVEGREDHYVVPLLPSLTATSYYIQTEVIIDIEEGSGIEFLTMFAGEMALLSNYTWSVVKPNAKVVMRISELEDEVEAEDVEKDFEIFIKTPTGVTLSVRIKGSETVLALKSKIEGFGPPDAQRLEFAGKQLEEDQTMAYYSIVDQSMLQLVTT